MTLRLVEWVGCPPFSPMIGTRHRVHALLACVADAVGRDGRAHAPLRRSALGAGVHPILNIAGLQQGLAALAETTISNCTLP
jgi:hypothetical protein